MAINTPDIWSHEVYRHFWLPACLAIQIFEHSCQETWKEACIYVECSRYHGPLATHHCCQAKACGIHQYVQYCMWGISMESWGLKRYLFSFVGTCDLFVGWCSLLCKVLCLHGESVQVSTDLHSTGTQKNERKRAFQDDSCIWHDTRSICQHCLTHGTVHFTAQISYY